MQKQTRFLIIMMVTVYLVLLGLFIKSFNDNPGGPSIRFYIPWTLILFFISFYLFREYNRVKKAKREARREELNARRQELLDKVIKASKKDNKETDE